MRLLVLGGTWFVGRAVVNVALANGHDVTVFNRGVTPVTLPTEVAVVRGDRTRVEDLRHLAGLGPWDAVIDVPGVVPREVRDAARALAPVTGRYAFVSTVSAYRDWPHLPVTEDSPLHDNDPDADPGSWEWGKGVYGPLKAGSETALRRELDHDCLLVVRPGATLGPGEYGGRLTWWLHRANRGGRLLAPGGPGRTMRPIDVRDVAEFIVSQLQRAGSGTCNLSGQTVTWDELITTCLTVTGADGAPVWVPDEWLTAQGVRQWTELPMWRTAAGTWAVDTTRATAAGLTTRPLRETVADTWAWLTSGGRPVVDDRQSKHGLDPAREAELLIAWDQEATGRAGLDGRYG